MSEELIKALVTIGFGALAGGLTNTIAIWMLFHPYTPPTLGGRKLTLLQGAIPKNQPRLAGQVRYWCLRPKAGPSVMTRPVPDSRGFSTNSAVTAQYS